MLQDDSAEAGWVIKPEKLRLLCSYAADGHTMQKV